MKKYLVGAVLIAGILGLISVIGAEPTQTKTATLNIEGMTCGACASAAKVALKKLDGVTNAKVSYKTKEAIVEYIEGKVSTEEMVDAVDSLGYKTNVKPNHEGDEK